MLILAYGIVVLVSVLILVLFFFALFYILFGSHLPATEVIVLNTVMILIALQAVPILNEIFSWLRSIIKKDEINLGYVIRKLDRLVGKKFDYEELAEFLAKHLHFDYVGIVINGRIYGSEKLQFSSTATRQIATIKHAESNSVWQTPSRTTKKALDTFGIRAVAELRNAKGRPNGQLLLGRNTSGRRYDRYNMIQLEMIINLVANVIDLRRYSRK